MTVDRRGLIYEVPAAGGVGQAVRELWDKRDTTPLVGADADRPDSPYEGQQHYRTDTQQIEVWDGSSWQTIGGSTPGPHTLGSHTDVTITTPTTAQFLRYSGSAWVNQVVAWADVSGKPSTFTPSAHASSHHSGGGDALTLSSIAGTISAAQHGNLSGTTSTMHHWDRITSKPSSFTPSAHAIESAAGYQTGTCTTGQFLRGTGTNTFAFQAIQASDLPSHNHDGYHLKIGNNSQFAWDEVTTWLSIKRTQDSFAPQDFFIKYCESDGATEIVTLDWEGNLEATSFTGNGSQVTNVNAAQLDSQTGTWYRSRTNHTGTQAITSLTAGTEGYIIKVVSGTCTWIDPYTVINAVRTDPTSTSQSIVPNGFVGIVGNAHILDMKSGEPGFVNKQGAVSYRLTATYQVGTDPPGFSDPWNWIWDMEAQALSDSTSSWLLKVGGTAKLTVTQAGLVTATTFSGSGANLTNLPAGQLSGTVPSGSLNGSYTGITGVGTVTAGTWSANTIGPTKGGTGQGTVTVGDLLYGSGTNTWGRLGIGATGRVLTSNGSTPYWAVLPTTVAAEDVTAGTFSGVFTFQTSSSPHTIWQDNGTTPHKLFSVELAGSPDSTSRGKIVVWGRDATNFADLRPNGNGLGRLGYDVNWASLGLGGTTNPYIGFNDGVGGNGYIEVVSTNLRVYWGGAEQIHFPASASASVKFSRGAYVATKDHGSTSSNTTINGYHSNTHYIALTGNVQLTLALTEGEAVMLYVYASGGSRDITWAGVTTWGTTQSNTVQSGKTNVYLFHMVSGSVIGYVQSKDTLGSI